MTTAFELAQLRRYIAEPSPSGTWTNEVLEVYLSGTFSGNDLNAVASQIWYEKSADLQATTYDYSADGESLKRNQLVENAIRLARMYHSKRQPTTSVFVKDPEETDDETEL